ncbi:scaffolding protein [Microbacterium phage Zeta1847]|uniref:Scaffolding protein n=1 Tax=Microbacterium phage Zeta1847 TaxID=2201444 RepID=A0A2Z4Q9X1_9CAUD|nr:head scaffolding protein [Microbacterium phage Zeta1847]AWY06639.1 scaffolding protein [Microbacterium phage Zeta1847]
MRPPTHHGKARDAQRPRRRKPPMSTDNPADKPADKPAETPSTPPWGDDFDAARAWDTITKLRGIESELKAKVAELETAAEAMVPKADLDAAIARAETAEGNVKAKTREAILAKAELPDDLHAFVTAEDEEGIAEQVSKLKAALTPKAPEADKGDKPGEGDPADTDKGTPPAKSSRPAPGLKPGHGGDDPVAFDPDAVVAAIRS